MIVTLGEFESIEEAPCNQDDKWFDGWLMIEDGEWISYGKYDLKTSIVKHVESDKYYQYSLSRTGSYYSDYTYSHREDKFVKLYEVKPVEKTVVITEWKLV